MMRHRSRPLVMLFVCAVALLAPRAPVRADTTAGLVTACTAANLAAAVAQADYVSFACGPAPVTITTGELSIPAGRSVTIDGGDLVTLSGGEANRLFNVAAGAELTLQHLTLLAGVAPNGGAILNAGTLSLVATTLRDNRANDPEGSGGAISNQAGTVQIVAGTFLNNRANGRGGAIANHDGALTVADSLFERNEAVDGGAINSTGMLTITNGALLENLADGGAGGAISLYAGEAVISGASLEANVALFGGGLFLSGEREARAVLRDSLVRDHVLAERFPGALGGGIYATGDLMLERVALDGNSANNGGGLLISGPNGRLSARDATISNNNATGVGGGLLLGAGGGHELTNVTVSGNSAGSLGGGVYGQNTPTTLRHVSLVNNRAPTGANLYAQRTSLTLQATILAAPQLGANCAGDGTQPTIASLGANMADDGSCAFAAAGDRNFADLIAGALDDNGGQTLTHLPGSASPAVDAAPIAGCPERDQRGFMRPAGAQCDSGATEVGATPPPDAPPFTPLQRPGGQRGTISLTPNQGAAGQTILVSGQAPNRATGILIATVVNGQTIVGAEAPVSTAGAYTLSLTVPPGLAAGPTQICAIPRGVAYAELACAAFTVAPMPPGRISGGSSRLSGGQAVLQLFDPNQRLAYTTPIDANGNFQLPNVTPGVYAYAVSGRTNAPVGGGIVALRPGTQIDLSRELSANLTTCLVHSSARVTGVLGIRPPPDPNAPSPYAGFTIVGQAFNPNRDMIDQLNLELRAEVERNAFGTYIQGVPTWVTFTAYPQTREPVQYVLYRFYDPNDKLIAMRLRPAPFELEYDVAALPARHSPEKTAYMTVTPVVAGKEVPCAPRYDIDVVPNPLAKRGVQPAPYSTIAMDYGNEQYRFTIAMPHVPGLLPWSYSFPRLPLVGVLNNRLNTGIQAEGTVKLNGATTISAFRAINDIYILNNQVLGPYSRQPLQILPNSTNGTCPSGATSFGLNDWNRQVYYVRYANPNLEVGIEPVDVPILPLFGVAEVAVRAGGSNAAGVLIAACIAPLRPEASLVLEPYLQKKRVQGLNVKLLAGVAHVGADLYSDEKLLYVFPDGRFVPAWTRPLAVAWAGLTLAWLVFPELPFNTIYGPTWRATPVASLLVGVGWFSTGVVALTLRYLHVADPVQRRQTWWVAAGLIAAVLGGMAYYTLQVLEFGLGLHLLRDAYWVARPALQALGMALLPLCLAVAILRYRLFDLEIIVNRALVHGTLTLFVIGAYIGVVTALSALFSADDSLLFSLIATGLIAVLFQPLRLRLQRRVDQLIYGARHEPYSVLADLGRRLEGAIAPERVLTTIVEAVATTLRLPYAAIAQARPEAEAEEAGAILAEYRPPPGDAPRPAPSAPQRFPMVYRGQTLGYLLVASRSGEVGFRADEERLLHDLTRQAGSALHALQLTLDLQRSRERIVGAREEERRRIRRDLHDGMGPTLASVVQRVRLATALIPNEPARSAALLTGVEAQLRDLIADIRRLVYALRPPALDQYGLVEAIRQESAALAGTALKLQIDAPADLPTLPAAVEMACYRIALEAVTNVVHHAQARTCTIRLSLEPAARLTLSISDDGRGIPPDAHYGVGLRSMRERAEEIGGTLTVETPPNGGTCVCLHAPLQDPSTL